jgi:hypothetical protein
MGQLAAPGVPQHPNFSGIVPLLHRWRPEAFGRQVPILPGKSRGKPPPLRNKQ